MTKKLLLILALTLTTALAGCSRIIPEAYRIDIPQGNLLTEEQVKAVKIGMNRRQVQNLLGSPLLVDTFNQRRWDYFYSVDDKNGTTIEHHVTITFKDDVVALIEEHL